MGRRTPYTLLNRDSDFYDEKGQLKDGYSYEGGADMVARGTVATNVRSGAGKDGLSYKKGSRTVYGKETKATPAPAPAPKPMPRSAPKSEPKPETPVEHSPEIQQAKERVKNYESNMSSAWDNPQATVQSSFIKPSSNNQQYDFASESLDANESPKPNEKALAAQLNLDNFISKYSQN
jgi:hypothetical protein